MQVFDKIKLAVFEASKNNLIDKKATEELVNFCESADINNPNDRAVAGEILDILLELSESTDDDVEVPVMTKEDIKLNIFESERCGDITKEEMEDLLIRLESAFE